MEVIVQTILAIEKAFGPGQVTYQIQKALADVHYGPASRAEEENKRYRQSIWAVSDIKKGEKLTQDKVKVKRPAVGLEPKFYEQVLGKTAKVDIELGTPITPGLFE